jgi:hypothetical protein
VVLPLSMPVMEVVMQVKVVAAVMEEGPMGGVRGLGRSWMRCTYANEGFMRKASTEWPSGALCDAGGRLTSDGWGACGRVGRRRTP